MRDVLWRIGPRPVLFGRYAAHRIVRRVGERRLRTTYRRRVTSAPPVRLRLPTIGLAPLAALPAPLRESAKRILTEADFLLVHQATTSAAVPSPSVLESTGTPIS